jgi:aminopeptidase N
MPVVLGLISPLAGQGGSPGPGISRDLARSRRAQIATVTYELHFDLAAGLDRVAGSARVRFTTAGPPKAPIVLDFAGEELSALVWNGRARDLPRADGHVALPATDLVAGDNELRTEFTSRVAATGTPLTRFHDAAAGHDYLYTLLVPADAHRLFPCFDQPDLKASFVLTLSTPADWQAVSNGQATSELRGERRHWTFAPTAPLSTYLFAFAAGPFVVVEDETRPPVPARLFVRQDRRQELQAELLLRMHRDGLARLQDYFGIPYPFGKLDLVLLPGFPFGGMEHAGAIFYAEPQLVFDHPPTESEQVRRSTLIYHEVTHQWFGNLVTMEWFDDLWLKEGFATFFGYRLLAQLEPGRNAWLRFHQRVKPPAYQVDGSDGTTPIWQQLGNLADAKSAYGPIVYNKAPAVLRELEARLGADAFQRGVRRFLQAHAFGTARWEDLVTAFDEAQRSAGVPRWSQRWILDRGMPAVRVEWREREGRLEACALLQQSVHGDARTWPMRVDLLLLGDGEEPRELAVTADQARTEIESLRGAPAPRAVLLNHKDVGYGRFLLDERSREHLLAAPPHEPGATAQPRATEVSAAQPAAAVTARAHALHDPVARAVAVTALFEAVREGELDPRRFARFALQGLQHEADPESFQRLLATFATCATRYVPDHDGRPLVAQAVELLRQRLERGAPGLELDSFRFVVRHGTTEAALRLCSRIAAGEPAPPGLVAGARDRFLAAGALLAAGRGSGAVERLAAEPGLADVARHRYVVSAAEPTAAAKAKWYEGYQQIGEPPEQWMQESLAFFHWPGQEALTLPYLRQALARLAWVKQHRRIFFLPAWIDAYVNAHSTPNALATVEEFLKPAAGLPDDVRNKLLQSADELRRAVRLRAAWR